MNLITALSNEPKQQIIVTLNDNTDVEFYFEYKQNQLGWFFDFKYNNQEYKNIRLTASYNILRAYRNWLPFGIACMTIDGEEPMFKDDFISGYASVFILTKDDVNAVEGNYYEKV